MTTNLRTPQRVFFSSPTVGHWRLLPEEDVPEKQPAGIHQQGYERVNQRAVQEVVEDALRDDWQVEQPTIQEADRHLLQFLEEKDRKEERARRAEDDQDEGW